MLQSQSLKFFSWILLPPCWPFVGMKQGAKRDNHTTRTQMPLLPCTVIVHIPPSSPEHLEELERLQLLGFYLHFKRSHEWYRSQQRTRAFISNFDRRAANPAASCIGFYPLFCPLQIKWSPTGLQLQLNLNTNTKMQKYKNIKKIQKYQNTKI